MKSLLLMFICVGVLMELPTITEYTWFSIYTSYSLLQMKLILYFIQLPWYMNIIWGIIVDRSDLSILRIYLCAIGVCCILLWTMLEYVYEVKDSFSTIWIMSIVELFPSIYSVLLFKRAHLEQAIDPNIIIKSSRCITIGKIIGSILSKVVLRDEIYFENIYQCQTWFIFVMICWIILGDFELNQSNMKIDTDESDTPVNINHFVVYMFLFSLIPTYSFVVMFYLSSLTDMNTSSTIMTFLQSLDYVGEFIGTFIIFKNTKLHYIASITCPLFIICMMIYGTIDKWAQSQFMYVILGCTTIVIWTIDSSLSTTFTYKVNRSVQYKEQGYVSNLYYFIIFIGKITSNIIMYTSCKYYEIDYNNFSNIQSVIRVSVCLSLVLVLYTCFLCKTTN